MTAVDLKRTALGSWHRAHAAKVTEFAGWEMPLHYEAGILQEHLATRKYGGLFDISHMGCFWIRGQAKIAFLQHVLTNNAEALSPWQAQYTLIPNAAGGALDDVYLYRFGEHDYILVTNAANHDKDGEHFRERAGHFRGVTVEDDEEMAKIAFQGPLSGRILEGLIEGGSLPEPFHNRLSEMVLCGTKVLVSRTGYTGEPIGFELFLPGRHAEAVWSALYRAGKERGVVPAGLGARDTLRLEAGLPLHGHELGLDFEGREIPAFAVLMATAAVSFSGRKGEFVGRRALALQFEEVQSLRSGLGKTSGVLARWIRPLAVLDQGVARRGDEVFLGPRKVGVVTSGTVAPYWQFAGEGATMTITDRPQRRAIALAYVDVDLPPGREVEVEVRNRRLRAAFAPWHGRSEAPPYFRPIPAGLKRAKPASPAGTGIEKVELLLKRSLENHEWRQRRCINLIPSEMTPSPLVRLLQVSDPVGRYAEHKELLAAFGEEVFYYQGTDFIAWVEDRLTAEMTGYLGCPQVELRTVSGQMANMTVFSAFVDYKNRFDRHREPQRIRLAMNNHLGRGGHLSSQPMGALRDCIAKDPVTEQFAVVNFPVRKDDPYRIDLETTAALLERRDPEIIIFGKSMVLYPEPVAEVRKLVEGKTPRPVLMYDMAHVLGLVGPRFQEPFRDGADIVTGSTHKTFFGTQRGIIGADFASDAPQFELWKAIRRRTFPGALSNHHLGTLLGLLLAAMEMNAFKDDYQRQVIANAKAFARALAAQGLAVEGDPAVGYTETHQVLVNVGYAKGCEVARTLEDSNIIVNYQALPRDESFTSSSGLRMGVSEMTRFGMKEADFEEFAVLMADMVKRGKHVGDEVARLRRRFQEMHYCFRGDTLEQSRRKLLETF